MMSFIRKTGCAALMAVLLVACSGEKELTPEEAALLAAKETACESYQHLLAGRYDKFIDGREGMDSIPQSYREQLTTACKQFIDQQKKTHGGIRAVRASNARRDTTMNLVQVFLILNYGDRSKEEIVVPMVEKDGRWKMK